MRGQVWTEYLLLAAAFAATAVIAFSLVFEPVREAALCSAAHLTAQKEITRQELGNLVEYTLKGLSCNIEKGEINVECVCGDTTKIKNAVKDVAKKFGVNATVRVVP